MKETVLLYHSNCPDGFGAAWSFWRKYGNSIDYIPVSHGAEPPDVSGLNVFMADFCYKRDVLLSLKDKAKSITVLDHHKSAEEDCGDLDFCTFDMDHSGAYMAWRYLNPNDRVPLLIRYVEDRDLWRWRLDSTESILSAVDSFEKTFENWDMLSDCLDEINSPSWGRVKTMGDGILQYKRSLISSLMRNVHNISIAGKSIPAINIPFFQSEVAAELAKESDYAAAYYFDGESYKFSLRSRPDGDDVSLVAGIFGGGGHKNAAGFRVDNLSVLNKGAYNE